MARALLHSRQRVRDRQSKIDVAVRRDRNFFNAGNFLTQRADELAVFLGHAVADVIGNVNRGGAGRDYGFDDLTEKWDVGAGGVLGREFNVVAQRLGVPDGAARLLQALLPRDAQLVFQVNVRGRQKNVDTRMRGSQQRLPGPVNVTSASTSQASNDGTPNRGGDALHGFEVAIGGDGESGFDHVHAQAVELLSQVQLFLHIHAAARRLLAVTKSGVENGDARLIHKCEPPGRLPIYFIGRLRRKRRLLLLQQH